MSTVRRELLEDKGAETLEIELGIGQKRLVTRPVGFGLSEQGFVGSRIDLRERVALPHVLAFAEGDLLYLPVDPNPDGHGIVRLHGAEADAIDREVLHLDDSSGDGKRPRRRCAGICRASRGATLSA